MLRHVCRRGCAATTTAARPSLASRASAAAQRLIASPDVAASFGPAVLAKVQFSASAIRRVSDGSDGDEEKAALAFRVAATDEASGAAGAIHGGALAALADVCTTVHLWALDGASRHVSVALDVQFVAPARVGRDVECVTRVTKRGKRLAFTEFEFVDAASGELLSKGSHTKAFL